MADKANDVASKIQMIVTRIITPSCLSSEIYYRIYWIDDSRYNWFASSTAVLGMTEILFYFQSN